METETIKVEFVAVGSPGLESYHGTLVYTNFSGQQFYATGLRGNLSMSPSQTHDPANIFLGEAAQATDGAIASPYGSLITLTGTVGDGQLPSIANGFISPDNLSITLATGSNLGSQWGAIVAAMNQINALNVPYAPITQNSNSAWCTAALVAGLSPPLGDAGLSTYWIPGCPNILPIPSLPTFASPSIQLNSLENPTSIQIAQQNPFGVSPSNIQLQNNSYGSNIAVTVNSSGSTTENASGAGPLGPLDASNLNIATGSDLTFAGSNIAVNLAPNASATVAGNSDTLTLGSNTSATINGKLDVLNGSIANLTIGAGSSAEVFGAYNTIVAGAGSTVTSFGDNISFSAAPNTSATFDASGTNDNFNVDNSLINIQSKNCTDGIHCQGDTINASTGDTIEIDGDGENGLADIVDMTSGTLDLSSNANDYMGPSTIRLMAA